MSKRRVVSSRITGKRIIGSANPVATWGRGAKKTCFDSIGGFFLGLLLFIIPFGLTYCAANTKKDSRVIDRLEITQVADAASISGNAIVAGNVTAGSTIEPEYGENVSGPILFYDYEVRRETTKIEQVERRETRVEGGQEVEVTFTEDVEVTSWEVVKHDSDWAELRLGSIVVNPGKCEVDLPIVTTFNETYTDAESGEPWEEVQTVIYSDTPAILAAVFENGRVVEEPDFYHLTSKTKEQLVDQLNLNEEFSRWGLLVLAVVLMTISFNLMLGPALLIINIFPIKQLSCAIRFVLSFVSLIISLILVSTTYVIVRYWWLIVLLLLGLAVWVIIEANRNRQANPDLDLDDDPGAGTEPA